MQATRCSTSHMQQGLRRAAQPFAAAPRNIAGPRRQQQQRLAVAVSAFATNSSTRSFAAATPAAFRSGASSSRRRLVVRANWGAPVEFSAAKLVSNSKVAEQLHKVVVDVGDLAAGYTKGGQFMQIKVTGCALVEGVLVCNIHDLLETQGCMSDRGNACATCIDCGQQPQLAARVQPA